MTEVYYVPFFAFTLDQIIEQYNALNRTFECDGDDQLCDVTETWDDTEGED